MEKYLKSIGCEYIFVDFFAYNDNAINFYTKGGNYTRMKAMIKKVYKKIMKNYWQPRNKVIKLMSSEEI